MSSRQQAVTAASLIALTVVLFTATAVVTDARDLRVDFFTNDPVALADQSWSTGLISRVEVLIWSAAAGVAVFAGAIARHRGVEIGAALIAIGLLTSVLVADDALLIHETVGDRVDVPLMQVAYIALFSALALRYGKTLASLSPWPLLATGTGLIALSVLIDSVSIDLYGITFAEDGAKVAGILVWSAYLAATSWHNVCAPRPQSAQSLS